MARSESAELIPPAYNTLDLGGEISESLFRTAKYFECSSNIRQ